MEDLKKERGAAVDTDLTADDLKELVERYKEVYTKVHMSFPEDPMQQLRSGTPCYSNRPSFISAIDVIQ
jgi:pyruvate,orthophosphate dikinase